MVFGRELSCICFFGIARYDIIAIMRKESPLLQFLVLYFLFLQVNSLVGRVCNGLTEVCLRRELVVFHHRGIHSEVR